MRTSLLALVFLPGAALPQEAPPDGVEFYEKKIRPVLEAKCGTCHGAKAERLKANLRLDTYEGLLKGGDMGPALVPGDLEKSLLIRAIRYTDEDLRMPPKNQRLDDEVIADFEKWVRDGAPHPGKAGAKGWKSSEADRWAFAPLRRVPVPPGADHPVDAFVQDALRKKGLAPAPPADRVTLLRRATFDLTGLPPTPEETEAFVRDPAPDAFARVVERLLAGPRYGEQWARHWLDVVRYADTSGFSNDFERPNAWRYRDYVIRSFNGDKPFDRFVLEQLAGDEIDPADPEMLVAVGFLRMGPWEHTAMSVAAVTRQQFLDDVTHATAATFLGLTLRCARCHDHKFDPIPTKDYYRVQAAFASTQFADRDAPHLPSENVADFPAGRARTEALLEETNRKLAALVRKNKDAVAAFLRERGVKSTRDLAPEDRGKTQHLGLTPQEMTLEKMYRKHREYYEREMKRYAPWAFSVYNGPPNAYSSNKSMNRMPARRDGPVQEISVLKGGALESPAEKVTPGVLSGLPVPADIPSTPEGRRTALARWVAAPENPLTSRVIVNRVWQHHFGEKGIVATPNNFGKMGRRPAHPELLDWLAAWFVESGRSIKKLHRLILLSETYRRAGAPPDPGAARRLDPANDLLSFYPPRRLAAEELRDSMLAVSGELSPAAGGPGVCPEINWEVALQPRHIMGSVAPAYQPSRRPAERNRRTIYAFRTRTLTDPVLEVFNQPGSEISCERRDETTVTPQAFALFNSSFAHDRALAFARRLEREAAGPARVDLAFRLAYARPPSEAERARCLEHLAAMTEHHRRHEPRPVPAPTRVRREMVEEFTGDTVAWEDELTLMKDYERDLKPWDVGPDTRALAEVCLVLFNSNEFLYVR